MTFPLELLDEGQAKVLAEFHRMSTFGLSCRAKAIMTAM
jgi:hypothetical protein